MTTPDTAADTRLGLRGDRGPILGALMLATALVALDATILATASTTIARELGAFEQVPWLFSAYTLAQAVTVPVYGRLADVLGRKRVMLVGIALFLLGSVLCAVAWSMPALIWSRVLQGLGAGAILPLSMTIASDIYTLAERARTQGYMASVWAVSSVLGPTLGGVFSQFVSWRWIFWVNVPIGAVALLTLWRTFREKERDGAREPVDYLGAVLLTGGSTLLVLGLLEGGHAWGWASPQSIGIFGASVVLLAAFAVAARRTAHPIFDLRLLRRRVVGASTAASLMVGVITLGLSTYVPIYAQGVLGVGPLVAGFALASLTLGWPIAATLSGRVYLTIGFRWTSTIGSLVVLAGTLLTLLLGTGSAVWQISASVFVIGLGMGLVAVPTLLAAQHSVGWGERGAVTATNMFARSIGQAVGVAALGAVVNALTVVGADGTPEGAGLADAMHLVFWCVVGCAALMVGTVLLLPRDDPRRAAPAA
ncbi:MDR family MFS transporter [Promicromonospora thailandica]|uniref:Drug resistance transporter, EmrB/QacA subfamily n=1 Tax=Promicromonospora thailandica TaxID=765201 RepID=A0A9X2G6G6_9MICO|nr:MDR family MFS transporter [Promicromonospora thailandica]MCP2264114.1 drug resistance transporter, EmrB/QacA subfamily [Promicromonospora thailandica]